MMIAAVLPPIINDGDRLRRWARAVEARFFFLAANGVSAEGASSRGRRQGATGGRQRGRAKATRGAV